jgi:hypothetical protein
MLQQCYSSSANGRVSCKRIRITGRMPVLALAQSTLWSKKKGVTVLVKTIVVISHVMSW